MVRWGICSSITSLSMKLLWLMMRSSMGLLRNMPIVPKCACWRCEPTSYQVGTHLLLVYGILFSPRTCSNISSQSEDCERTDDGIIYNATRMINWPKGQPFVLDDSASMWKWATLVPSISVILSSITWTKDIRQKISPSSVRSRRDTAFRSSRRCVRPSGMVIRLYRIQR